MIRKLIYYSMCMVCLALGGCTDDNMIPASQTEPSGQVVPVKLLLTTEVYNTPLSGKTRNGETNHVFSASYPEMDIELVETPATRAVAPGVEDAIYTYTILQFKGVTDAAALYYKKTYDCSDGVINTQNVELKTTNTGPNGEVEKHRFVVIANGNSEALAGLAEGASTYSDLQKLFITRATSIDQLFPLHDIRVSGVAKQAMIMCGMATASIDAPGKQISVALQRTVAKVTFNIETDNPAFADFKNWDVALVNIPTKSYLNILGRSAVFPGIDQMNRASAYWSKVLTEPIGETLPMGKSSYLPVNLQQTVITSTQATRRDNAPIGGTYVQIMGRKMAKFGTTTLPVVQDFVIYQIFLGKNLSTDYSVYPNNNLTYNITLKGRDEKDTNVVRFIPGRFSGALKAYTEDGTTTTTPAQAVEWKYEKRIETYFADAPYSYNPAGQEIEQLGRYDLRWYVGSAYNNMGATSLTNGYNNTLLLVSNSSTFYRYPAALACYGGLNGLNQGAQSGFKWYLPSITELIGTWISASSVASTLNTSYWSSTALNNTPKAFLITNEGEVRTGAVSNDSERHFIRGARDPDVDNAK